jgi:uncharacterized protein
LFGVNRAALYSFHETDHGERDGSALRAYVERRASEHGIDLTGGKVLLLCYPRLFGYTFSDTHSYVLPVRAGEVSETGVRQVQDKLFYVSPFVEMAMRYHFRIVPPGEQVKLRILETDREGPLLAATFSGRRRELTTPTLIRAFVALPLVTVKIIAAIHWEALRLWLKGARLVPRRHAAAAKERNTSLASGKSRAYIS